jgi:uncharacterized surface protein with fasciclin (FAS1) repeats
MFGNNAQARKWVGAFTAGALMTASMVFADNHAKKNIVETADAAGSFTTLLAAAKAAGLAETLATGGPFTVFAPTDDAFAKLPDGTVEALLNDIPTLKSILLYHVVSGKVMAADVTEMQSAPSLFGQDIAIETGEGVRVADANVVKTDIAASNGVIHVVDTVMMPKNIVEVAASNDDFSTLVTAVKAADLVDVLSGMDAFTVFAPTNSAFGKLDPSMVADLLKPENKSQLQSVLTFHVVPGRLTSEDVVKAKKLDTVQGESLKVKAEGDTVMVGGSKVVAVDVPALNGVIHVIDTVLVP